MAERSVQVRGRGGDVVQRLRPLIVVPDVVRFQEWRGTLGLARASGYRRALADASAHTRSCIILFWPTLSLERS